MSRAAMSLHPPSSPKLFCFVTAGKGAAVETDFGRGEGGRRWLAMRILPQQNTATLLLLKVFPLQPSSLSPPCSYPRPVIIILEKHLYFHRANKDN